MNIAQLLISLMLFQIDFSTLREVEERGILGDVLSHCDETLYYENPLTLFHENCHRANSMVNKRFKKPGFYILNDKAMILDREIPLTLNQIASNVPQSLRNHHSYQWYLVKVPQMQPNNNRWPSVILDEWVAFSHTCEYKIETNNNDNEIEIEYMLAFSVYSIVALMSHEYDESLFNFVKYQLNKTKLIYEDCFKLKRTKADEYLRKFLSSKDTENIRIFMRDKLEFEFK